MGGSSWVVQGLHTILQREAEAARRGAIPELIALAVEKHGAMLALNTAGPPTSEAEQELLRQVMKAVAENALVLDAVVGEIDGMQDSLHRSLAQAADTNTGAHHAAAGGQETLADSAPASAAGPGPARRSGSGRVAAGHCGRTPGIMTAPVQPHSATLVAVRAAWGLQTVGVPTVAEATALGRPSAYLGTAEQSRETKMSGGNVPVVPAPGPQMTDTTQPMVPSRARQGQAASAEPTLPPGMVGALIRRGDEMVRLGDISAARLLYERAAVGGSGRAATAAGRTYDATFLAAIGVRGIRGDPAAALAWYQRAAALGDHEGRELLARHATLPGE